MKTKTLDCVEMKTKGAEKINAMLNKMTKEEKIAYWKKRSEQFRKEQDALSPKSTT